MLGNHGLASQPAIIDAAEAAGVREFYPSEFGADIDVEPFLSTRYFRDKVITRKHLEMTAKKTPEFGYTYMLVGGIAEYLATPFFGVDMEKRTFTFYGELETKAAFTSLNEYGSESMASEIR
jgi:NmrA-like family